MLTRSSQLWLYPFLHSYPPLTPAFVSFHYYVNFYICSHMIIWFFYLDEFAYESLKNCSRDPVDAVKSTCILMEHCLPCYDDLEQAEKYVLASTLPHLEHLFTEVCIKFLQVRPKIFYNSVFRCSISSTSKLQRAIDLILSKDFYKCDLKKINYAFTKLTQFLPPGCDYTSWLH